MTARIQDLASKLNLSITTVSRALDGYRDVSEGTRRRVLAAADEMGYAPSYAARQLRRKRADAIGYILPNDAPRFSDPFYLDFIAGLCDGAAERQIDLLVSSASPGSEEEKQIYRRWSQSGRVDGFVLDRVRIDDWRIDYLHENGNHFVSLEQSTRAVDYPCVIVNEKGGMTRLVKYLVQKGCRRIGFIGAPETLTAQAERFKGYLDGLGEAGLSFDPELVCMGDLTENGGLLQACRLLELPDAPDAILGVNDLTALGILAAVEECGKIAGVDVAVAGYDGIARAENSNPPLTTLRRPTYSIARRLAGLVIALTHNEPLPTPVEVIEPELILRASTGESK